MLDTKRFEGVGQHEVDQEVRKLHIELCKVQEWIKQSDMKIVVTFDSPGDAGKALL
jgi:polyphosphate kinase 2 (PPK2 family)